MVSCEYLVEAINPPIDINDLIITSNYIIDVTMVTNTPPHPCS